MVVSVLADPAAVADEAARQVVAIGAAAIEARGRFLVALSGGSTPRALHARLAAPDLRARLDWSRVEICWSDERAVPPDHPDSNYRMARETLLDVLGLPERQVHRIHGESPDPEAAADDYACRLVDLAGGTSGVPTAPVLDLVLLGMGTDGHTASLFPHTPALDVTDRWVVPNRAPRPPIDRITITFPVIHAARAVRVIATGADKAGTLAQMLHGPRDPAGLPSQRLADARGDLRWLVDAAAGRS